VRSFTVTIVPHVELGDDVIISETAIIRAQLPFPDSRLVVGDRAHIYPFTIIDPSRPVTIGPETGVGFSTYIFSHGAYKDKLDGYPVVLGDVSIGRAVWLTCRVFIMPGVELGDDVVVGTGSVVTQSFPEGSFVLGEPAKLVKKKEEFVRHHSDDEKLEILRSILRDFCQFVSHFTDATIERQSAEEAVIRSGSVRQLLRIAESGTTIRPVQPRAIYLILGAIDTQTRRDVEAAGAAWFSHADHQCSAQLDAVGEEFREFLTRYGIYFERLAAPS
jgi:acetyltransferase-like isoleucine patch superfamily enzyme